MNMPMDELADRMHRQLIKARSTMLFDHPFFGLLALKMKLVPNYATPTFKTDGKQIQFNPKFAEALSFEQCIGVIAHETMHIADGHHWRRDGRDWRDWNKATDFTINPIIVNSGMRLPSDALIDSQYDGKSAEYIYGRIHQAPRPPDEPGLPSDEPGGAGGGQPPPADDQGGDEEQPEEQPEEQGDQDDQGEPMREPSSCGEVEDAPADVDIEEMKSDWQVAVVQAAQAATAMGKLPAGIKEMVDKIVNPEVPWKDVLRNRVQQIISRADYSWRRPNRRYVAQGVYLPEIRSERMPAGVIMWDTSGSMYDRETRAMAASEIAGIIDECRPEKVYVMYVDADVHGVDIFEPDDPIKFNPQGGGGTDFRSAFKMIEDEGWEPSFFIGITDLEAVFPTPGPEYPVIWASTENGAPPFGEVILVKP